MTGALDVGKTGTYVVGVTGPITARTETTITIAGHTLPFGLANRDEPGVHYMSIDLPSSGPECECDDDGICYEPHCTSECSGEELAELISRVELAHGDHHEGPFRYCDDPICRVVDRGV